MDPRPVDNLFMVERVANRRRSQLSWVKRVLFSVFYIALTAIVSLSHIGPVEAHLDEFDFIDDCRYNEFLSNPSGSWEAPPVASIICGTNDYTYATDFIHNNFNATGSGCLGYNAPGCNGFCYRGDSTLSLIGIEQRWEIEYVHACGIVGQEIHQDVVSREVRCNSTYHRVVVEGINFRDFRCVQNANEAPEAFGGPIAATIVAGDVYNGLNAFYGFDADEHPSEILQYIETNFSFELGLSVDIDSGQVSGVAGTPGEYCGLSVAISDGALVVQTAPFCITVTPVEPTNAAPALLTLTTALATVNIGDLVNFDVSATDPDGDLMIYGIDFGNGLTDSVLGATGQRRVSTTYQAAGTYTVLFTATDSINPAVSISIEVEVRVNQNPVDSAISLLGGAPVNVNDLVEFRASATDPEGDNINFSIDYGDGTTELSSNVGVDKQPVSFLKAYQAPGTYTVTLSVADVIRPLEVVSVTTTIEVIDNAPPIELSIVISPTNPQVNTEAAIIVSAVDGDSPPDLLNYIVDLGEGVPITLNGVTGEQPPILHTYTTPGTYTATLFVSDVVNPNRVVSAEVDFTVVAGGLPIAELRVTPESALVGQDVTFNASGSSDPNQPVDELVFFYDFGDGQFEAGVGLSSVSHQYQVPSPVGGFNALVTVTDGGENTATANFATVIHDALQCLSGYDNGSDPISHSTGNLFETEIDYTGAGPLALQFVRYYNSLAVIDIASDLGDNWRHNYDYKIVRNGNITRVFSPEGSIIPFAQQGRDWKAVISVNMTLTELAGGWRITHPGGDEETYNSAGQLTSIKNIAGHVLTLAYFATGQLQTVVDQYGRSLSLTYDTNGRLGTVTDPALEVTTYRYDALGNLEFVNYPDGTTRQYVYSNATYLHALTGVIDENGSQFAFFTFDEVTGRALSSSHAGNANKTTFGYFPDPVLLPVGDGKLYFKTEITDALGAVRTFYSRSEQGMHKTKEYNSGDPECTTCQNSYQSAVFDANGNMVSQTDFRGHVTNFTYDSNNLETQRIEAAGTAEQRATKTEWNLTHRLPECIIEANRTVDLSYLANGQLQFRREFDTRDSTLFSTPESKTCATIQARADVASLNQRAWAYTYYTQGVIAGLLETVDGPRTDVTDVTTYRYNATTGNLVQIENALGHTIDILAHDAHGRPAILQTANGLISKLTYDQRGRLLRREEGTDALGYEVTEIQYDAVGNRTKVTLPNGAFLAYNYDGAQRLTGVSDQLGNRINYTLDALGNRLKTDSMDPAGTLRRTQAQVYSQANRLEKIVEANGVDATQYTQYDGNGNVLSVDDALSSTTQSAYDAHNRLTGVTDALSGVIVNTYDADNRITRVTDPRGNSTTYTYDGLGNLLEVNSPDAGVTRFTAHDGAGNPLAQMDATGLSRQFNYDALNRLDLVTYADGFTTSDYIYDEGVNGLGQLTRLVDNAGLVDNASSVSFSYDVHGRVLGQTQVVGGIRLTTGYQYDASGQLDTLTYPSGKVIKYSYVNGLADSLALGAVNGKPLVSAMGYEPMGPLSRWTWGNGTSVNRTYALDGRISGYPLGATANRTLTYTPVGNVSELRDAANPANNLSYGYNALSQLTDFSGLGETQVFTYDANGNRNGVTLNGTLYTYALQGSSNRLTSISGPVAKTYSYDGAGRLKSGGVSSYNYDLKGRLGYLSIGNKEASYTVNALGQRVKKQISVDRQVTETVLYVYAEDGRLRGEYTQSGAVLREYVWVGDQPLVTLEADNTVRYVYTDHLNTPRAITDEANAVIWQWESDPFGVTQPNGDVDGDGVEYTFNLRFAGQYYDQESGLHYNYFRTYDPATGRYITSDPVGLDGGLNTYLYANANPIIFIDPTGENPFVKKGIEKALKKTNIQVDGPSPGLAHGNGRVFGIRHKKKNNVFRLDFQPIPGSGGESRLHCHIGNSDGHIPLDPRSIFD